VAKATGTTLGAVKGITFNPLNLFVACYNHLRNALAIGNGKWFIGEIHKNNTHLTTIIGINGAG
jgi:hypothetical protein